MKKIVLVMVAIAFILSGCSIEQEKKQTGEEESIDFKYPDEYFNDICYQKETGNKYVIDGQYVRTLNKKDEVIRTMDVAVDNKYLIANMVCHEGYVYMRVFNINQSDVPLFGLARMKDDGSDFEYLFHIEENIMVFWGMGIYEDTLEISYTQDDGNGDDACLSYSINDNLKKEIKNVNPYTLRKKYIKNKYSELEEEYLHYLHIINDDIYFENRAGNMQKYNTKTNAIEEYDIHKYFEGGGHVLLGFIDGYWYFDSAKTLYKVSLDFSEEQLLFSSDKSYYFTTNEQGQTTIAEY